MAAHFHKMVLAALCFLAGAYREDPRMAARHSSTAQQATEDVGVGGRPRHDAVVAPHAALAEGAPADVDGSEAQADSSRRPAPSADAEAATASGARGEAGPDDPAAHAGTAGVNVAAAASMAEQAAAAARQSQDTQPPLVGETAEEATCQTEIFRVILQPSQQMSQENRAVWRGFCKGVATCFAELGGKDGVLKRHHKLSESTSVDIAHYFKDPEGNQRLFQGDLEEESLEQVSLASMALFIRAMSEDVRQPGGCGNENNILEKRCLWFRYIGRVMKIPGEGQEASCRKILTELPEDVKSTVPIMLHPH